MPVIHLVLICSPSQPNPAGGEICAETVIRVFCNKVILVPAGVAAEDKNHADSQVPGSPKVSSFPNIPDMSPKKVSAAHNVYVSPLRQTKVCLHARLCNSV
ncbi:hypothetical protein BHE74_00029449 [Ensete ventricosum]|uniref:Uncharacterized protein n=1 Tax=Ensete ventricosum TaxID=4639 RepID=A0A427B2N0_ENSVE|nr:hypothetical protein B296_00006944 [Ensete ventricosum]RWW63376.1 hypothetical protein BHE74_00029449 [Ensete ventricosum]